MSATVQQPGKVKRRVSGRGSLLMAPDARNTVLAERDRQTRNRVYCAHGYHRATGVMAGALGFNGEYVERHGLYLLGSYRAYSPALKLFCSPDSLSPFGAGGLNPYAYCLGDPVNHVDPTGHMPWWASLVAGIAASVLTAGITAPLLANVGMAVATAKLVGSAMIKVATAASATSVATTLAQEVVSDQTAKDVLGWVSFGSGIAGGMAAGLGLSMHLIKRGAIGMAGRSSTVTRPTTNFVNPLARPGDESVFNAFRGPPPPYTPRAATPSVAAPSTPPPPYRVVSTVHETQVQVRSGSPLTH